MRGAPATISNGSSSSSSSGNNGVGPRSSDSASSSAVTSSSSSSASSPVMLTEEFATVSMRMPRDSLGLARDDDRFDPGFALEIFLEHLMAEAVADETSGGAAVGAVGTRRRVDPKLMPNIGAEGEESDERSDNDNKNTSVAIEPPRPLYSPESSHHHKYFHPEAAAAASTATTASSSLIPVSLQQLHPNAILSSATGAATAVFSQLSSSLALAATYTTTAAAASLQSASDTTSSSSLLSSTTTATSRVEPVSRIANTAPMAALWEMVDLAPPAPVRDGLEGMEASVEAVCDGILAGNSCPAVIPLGRVGVRVVHHAEVRIGGGFNILFFIQSMFVAYMMSLQP